MPAAIGFARWAGHPLGSPIDLEVVGAKATCLMRWPTDIGPHGVNEVYLVRLSADHHLAGHIGKVDEIGSGRHPPTCQRLSGDRAKVT